MHRRSDVDLTHDYDFRVIPNAQIRADRALNALTNRALFRSDLSIDNTLPRLKAEQIKRGKSKIVV